MFWPFSVECFQKAWTFKPTTMTYYDSNLMWSFTQA